MAMHDTTLCIPHVIVSDGTTASQRAYESACSQDSVRVDDAVMYRILMAAHCHPKAEGCSTRLQISDEVVT